MEKNEKIKEWQKKVANVWQKVQDWREKNKKKIAYFSLGVILVGLGVASFFVILNLRAPVATYDVITNVYAEKKAGLIVKPDSSFILETKKTDLETVKKHVYLSNNIDYKIEQISSRKYRLIPEAALTDNNIFTIESVDNETPTYKWAFQTKRELSVTSVFPNNNYTDVDSVIELEFSMANIEDLSDYVEISNGVEGKWTHVNYTWVFEPDKSFAKNTEYQVTVKKGLKAGDNELKEDYTFNFKTDKAKNDNNIYTFSYSLDGSSTFTPLEKPVIVDDSWYEESCPSDYKMTIYKYASQEEYLAAIESDDLSTNITDLTEVGNYSGTSTNCNYTYNSMLETGYYLGLLETSSGKGYKLIQVSELGVYIAQTQKDILVWVTESGNKKAGIKVLYGDSEVTTDEQGMAKLTDVTYPKDSSSFIRIGNKAGNELITTLADELTTWSQGTGFVYTDRPIYKNTDTVEIWGYVPLNMYYDKVVKDVLITADDGTSKNVRLNDDGTFSTRISLKDYGDSYLGIDVEYNGQNVGSRWVEIYEYETQIYDYAITTDREAYAVGDKIEAKINVSHITGIPVEGKKIKVSFNGKTYTAKTDAASTATFSLTAPDDEDYYSSATDFNICVYNGETEDYNAYTKCKYVSVYVRDIFFDAQQTHTNDGYTVTINTNKVDLEKINTILQTNANLWDLKRDEYVGDVYNTTATYQVIENKRERVVTGKYYDEYSQTYINEYDYIDTKKVVETNTIEIKDGIATINNLKYEEVNSEDIDIYYNVEISLKDQKGRDMVENVYLYDYEYYIDDYYYEFQNYNADNVRYYFEADKEQYSIGETVNLTLYDNKGNVVENAGKILLLTYKNGIVSEKIFKDSNISYEFTEAMYPGNEVVGAYLLNGHLSKINGPYVDYKEKDREVKINITPDKDKYQPGDEVTLKIATTDTSDKPLATAVNISVVDEAIFKMLDIEAEDSILNDIYSDIYYPSYGYASYFDYDNKTPEAGGYGGTDGDGSSARMDFKDTAHFESMVTDENGIATLTFKLPDNVTSYRVTAHAANKDAYVGDTYINVKSTLDFFIESTVPRNVKYTDDLVVNASALGLTGETNYTFTIKELNKTESVTATNGSYANVNFGKLPIGEYTLNIKATNGEYSDAVEYKIEIVSFAQEIPIETTKDLKNSVTINPTSNPIKINIYNKQTETYIKYLNALTGVYSKRLDTQLAYYVAQDLRTKFYGGEVNPNIRKIAGYTYQGDEYYDNKYNYSIDKEGLALLTNESYNPLFTALVAKYAAQYITYDSYQTYADNILIDTGSDSYEVYCAYLIKSAINSPILEELASLKSDSRSIRENLVYALSYAFLGDYDTATAIYNEIMKDQDKFDSKEDEEVLAALLATMIDKDNAEAKLDKLVENNLTNEYIRFALISFLENNSPNITEEKTVKVTYGDTTKELTVKGLNVESLIINKDDLKNLVINSISKDLVVSYYYNSNISELKDDSINKDVTVKLIDAEEKYADAILRITFNHKEDSGLIKIALPNSLRFDSGRFDEEHVSLRENKLDSISFYYYDKDSSKMTLDIPLIVTNSGGYLLEPVVIYSDDTYHISDSIEFSVK